MSRDSILDEAEKQSAETEADDSQDDVDDAEDERERLTQRVPADLLEDVEQVQEEFKLPSRNATINFMLNRAADDLLR